MSKEIKDFDTWWMLQSKIPYRAKKEIANSAWHAAESLNRVEQSKGVPQLIIDTQKFTDELGIFGMVGSIAWKAQIKRGIKLLKAHEKS